METFVKVVWFCSVVSWEMDLSPNLCTLIWNEPQSEVKWMRWIRQLRVIYFLHNPPYPPPWMEYPCRLDVFLQTFFAQVSAMPSQPIWKQFVHCGHKMTTLWHPKWHLEWGFTSNSHWIPKKMQIPPHVYISCTKMGWKKRSWSQFRYLLLNVWWRSWKLCFRSVSTKHPLTSLWGL